MTAASHPKSPRHRKERRIIVRSVRRDPPDLKAFAKALVDTVLRDLDEEAGLKPKVSPPPGRKHY